MGGRAAEYERCGGAHARFRGEGEVTTDLSVNALDVFIAAVEVVGARQ